MQKNIDAEEVLKCLSQTSNRFEQSIDALHRKQTGSYYTALELTCIMMEEMINSLSETERVTLYKKKFLEPCVGTGNFVIAYIHICRNLEFTREQYLELLNNIYACDINQEALMVYKNNLSSYVKSVFDIDLDEDYFRSHIGKGLMIDVDSASIKYIPLEDVFPLEIIGDGFDFVVTNPPYKNLKAEKSHYKDETKYSADKSKYAAIAKISNIYFPYSSVGTLNLYKLFVEEIINKYVSPTGVCSLLIPASILSDKTCSALRTHILETCSLKSIRIIGESSYYVDANQALCAVLLHKGEPTESVYIDGSFSDDTKGGAVVEASDFLDTNTGNAILVLSAEEYKIRKKMQESPLIKNIQYIHNLRGELDITLNKKYITTNQTEYCLYRGRNIGHYKTKGEDIKEFVNEEFVKITSKKKYIDKERIICQQIVNAAKKQRISYALIRPGIILANSCNFIALEDNVDNVDYYFLLGILNSKLINWFFKVTSSNNHINNYEIDNFPIPIFYGQKNVISDLVKKYIASENNDVLDAIENEVRRAYGLLIEDSISDETKAKKGEECMFKNKKLLINEFTKACSSFLPSITSSICKSILEGKSSLEEIQKKHCAELSSLEEKALNSVEIKFRKIYENEVLNHTGFKLSKLDLEMIKSVPQGGSWKDIPAKTVQKSKRLLKITQTGGRSTLYGRIDYKKPSYTITTYFNRPGNGTYVHPTLERVISVREAARFQSFPDDYYFYGNKTDMLKQVGNAVPVLLAYQIGNSIKSKTGCSVSVDLFSGAGGMTLGFKAAGIKAVIANDIMKSACVTLKCNNPEIPVLCGDITRDDIKSIIIQRGMDGNADIICGGPPCQGFSMAGYRMKNDPRNQMFRHFVDIVSCVKPKIIVFENVEGLLTFQGGETYREIIKLFSELGYYTEGRKLQAHYYGVPQKRKRVIILCTKKELGITPSYLFPEPITPDQENQITAHDAIYDLENIECGEKSKYTSDFSSLFLKYLKNELSAAEYVNQLRENNTGTLLSDLNQF